MGIPALPRLAAGDLVACVLPPGEAWIPLLQAVWDAQAALMPVDVRASQEETTALLRRARPTVVVAASGADRVPGAPVGEGVGAVIATSGSSGAPRLVELDRGALSAAVTASGTVLGATPDDPWLCCIPVAHIGGLLVLLRAVVSGAPVTVQPGFAVDHVREATRARFISVVPTQLRRLFDAGVDCTRFRAMLIGGAPLPAELAADAQRRGVNAVTTYGLTESCGGVVYNGRPLPGTEVRVTADGEVQLRGPTLLRRYRFDERATASAFTGDGWLRTRDAGAIVHGVLTVLGRLDDAIVSGGEKVWPLEVEAALATHPAVAKVAVRGRADPEWGERVVAFVVPRDGAAPSLASLRAHVATQLARYKAPRELVIVDALSRTSLGKVRRDPLRAATDDR